MTRPPDAGGDARLAAERLRQDIRQFCAHTLPAALRDKASRHQVLDKADYRLWMQLLQRQGWGVGHWPQAHGGAGWSALEHFVFEDELARQGCPWVLPFGVKYVGPVICTYGTPAQQRQHLPGIVGGEVFWAQGYSEPGAGSDLAALRTRARREGDHYVVSGQKTWTTYAQWADWLFCLVRTDKQARPQQGITFLLIDMRSPGITVKPIRTMDGYHHVNEVWLEEVRVPLAQRVGDEGTGWTIAKFLLRNERTSGAVVGTVRHVLQRLQRLAAESWVATAAGRVRLIDEPQMRQRLGDLALRAWTLEETAYQAMDALMAGGGNGAEASLLKLRGSELYQEIAEALTRALGPAGIAYDPAALHSAGAPPLGPPDAGGLLKDHFYNRAATIFGGSSEVQRNILAKVVLGP